MSRRRLRKRTTHRLAAAQALALGGLRCLARLNSLDETNSGANTMIDPFRRKFLLGMGALALTPLLRTAVAQAVAQSAQAEEIDFGAVLS